MKKLQFLPLMALVLGLGLTTAMSAFKTLTPPTDGWFAVTVIDPFQSHSDPTNLAIGARLLANPPSNDEEACAINGNEGDVCAVHLEFTPSATAVPEKVSDVNPTYSRIEDTAEQPE